MDRKALICFFKDQMKRSDAEQLADDVIGIVNHSQKQKAERDLADKALSAALKKMDGAIDALKDAHDKGYANNQTRFLLERLCTLRDETGKPGGFDSVVTMFYQPFGDTIATEVHPKAKNATLISRLEAFWYKTFNERATFTDEHPLHELAGICTVQDAGAVRKARERHARPAQVPGDRG